ncbi:MAG: FHA domain-containing protein [Gemmataceae bacterium]|nr:FHA domain-containing protein [Gemmataceae bacterium]
MDPRLQSIHFQNDERLNAFRQARMQVDLAQGIHTKVGVVRTTEENSANLATLSPVDVPVKPLETPVCWLFDRGKPYPLHIGVNSVGRLPDNDVIIDDVTVSRRHCVVIVHSDLSCEIHDIASKNGTLVNGTKLQGVARLKDGDTIQLCDHTLRFVIASQNPNMNQPLSSLDSSDFTLVQ